MKLSDYIVDYIAKLGTKHIFTITGGAIAHVVDSVGRRAKEVGDIDYVCVQHEQAGAMAAEAYSRFGPGPGVAMVTSGPGATNLITGICGCWFDSIPTLFICGQVNSKESVESIKTKPRQVGFQETDIVSMVKPITKFAEKVTDPNQIKYFLDKAVAIAYSGRPGPALLDIPVDLQVADVDPQKLEGFTEKLTIESDSEDQINKKIKESLNLIEKAERPIILLGGGVRLAKAEKEAVKFVETLGFPTVVSWSGFDLLPHNHRLYRGHIGVYGDRGANLAVQNSDLLITLGSRLDTRQTGGRVNTFARAAKKIIVDIDHNEIFKNRGVKADISICADVKKFLQSATPIFGRAKKIKIGSWINKTAEWSQKYLAVLPEYKKEKRDVNAYAFVRTLSDKVKEGATIVADEGGNLVWTMQSWRIKKGQRLISTFGNSPMGYSFPAAIGACFALGGKEIICIDGDGGFQINLQELQTLAHYKLPIKIFILNNRGYGIIKQFQDLYFDARYEATGRGYSAPDFCRVAEAFGIKSVKISRLKEVNKKIGAVLAYKGPILCEVLINPGQKLIPKLEFGRPIEDMSPYLSRAELSKEMFIELLPEPKQAKGWQKA